MFSYRDENENLVTDSQEILEIWKQYYCTILDGDDDDNSTSRENASNAINNGCVDFPSPSHNEVRVAIEGLKDNKAVDHDGLPACLKLEELIR